jgi:hypothetical protein
MSGLYMSRRLQPVSFLQSHIITCSGNISCGIEPGPGTLRAAHTIDLTRDAGTESARALVADVTSLIAPHLKRTRKLGTRGQETQREHVAAILAGLLKPGFKGRPVAAQRRRSGGMWEVP